MKADISAELHDPAKGYTGVRAQQGRVLTDADVNAALDIVDASAEDLVRTLVCAAGSADTGFSVTTAESTTFTGPTGAVSTIALTIAPGSFVLGGKVLRLAKATNSLRQLDWLSLPLTPAELPAAPVTGRTDLAFLEVAEQPVRAVEDREIGERALDADTTSRIRPRARVRVFDNMPDDCADAAQAMRTLLAGSGGAFSADGTELLSNARLRVVFTNDDETGDPCAPQTVAGYLGAENHTLRIMLTRPGHFVWNYDHGGAYYRVKIDQGTGEIEFLTEPRDPVLFPFGKQVIEILPWDILLPNREKAASELGHRALLSGEYDPVTRRIKYDGSLPAHWQTWLNDLSTGLDGINDPEPRYFYARIWQANEGSVPDQPVSATVDIPGTGLQFQFSGIGFAGDYWTASFRTDAPRQVLPYRLGMNGGAAPTGPRRFYAPLATLDWTGLAEAAIHDCRNRFRSLCRITSCCTLQVGDGHTSFGDFNDLAEALEDLPNEGGEICLLPGTHIANLDLDGRRQIVIRGCGPRSIVVPAPGSTTPVFDLGGSRDVSLRNFAIQTDAQLAVGGAKGAMQPRLDTLSISVENAAVALRGAVDARFTDCDIRARARSEFFRRSDIASLRPLVFLQGHTLSITGCTLLTDQVKTRQLRALGGLQIGGDSRDVTVRDNTIRGGNGNGITLGSVVTISFSEENERRRINEEPDRWISIVDDDCYDLDPPGTRPPSVPPGQIPPRILSRGDIDGLEIRHNRIEDHGASGISVAWWFPAGDSVKDSDRDEIEIENAVIASNVIRGCMALNLVAALPFSVAFGVGFGGIVLSSTTDLQIEDNDIRDCGRSGRTPICGIFLRFAARTRIAANRIYDNGRPATLSSPLLIGNTGGIVIPHVEGQSDGFGTQLRQTPAVFIKNNSVVSQEGRALDLAGNGQMLIEGNAFTAHGNNSLMVLILAIFIANNDLTAGNPQLVGEAHAQFRALLAQVTGSAVSIVNSGMNPNLAAMFGFANVATTAKRGALLHDDVVGFDTSFREVPQGQVAFNDNAVVFDTLSDAITLSLCAITILSLDDVAMHDNQCSIDSGADLVLVNAVVMGLVSTRVQGNRFRERISAASVAGQFRTLSAVTMGILNATENNQGTHCFLRLGYKKPRIVGQGGVSSDLYLDTNRQVIPEKLCARFDAISRETGT